MTHTYISEHQSRSDTLEHSRHTVQLRVSLKDRKVVPALKITQVHSAALQTLNSYTVPVLRGQHDCFKHSRLAAELQHPLFCNKYASRWYTACVWVCGFDLWFAVCYCLYVCPSILHSIFRSKSEKSKQAVVKSCLSFINLTCLDQ